MKKILLLLVFVHSLFFITQNIYATDACEKIVLQNINAIGEASFPSNIRSYPCVYKSKVIRASKTKEQFEIIGKVDGWYKIKLKNGQIYWIWDKALKVIKNKKPSYILNNEDKKIINNAKGRIKILIEKKGSVYKTKLKVLLNRASRKYSKNPRLSTILNELLDYIKSINITNNNSNNKQNTEITFDIEKVKKTWLEWHNNERKKLGLKPYFYDEKLNSTAQKWSDISRQRGKMSHKRDLSDPYYDYEKITDWFKQNGVVCKNISRATNSESIGYYSGVCNNKDCTNSLLAGAKSIFDFYMAEKGTDNDAHYRAIKHNLFTKIGLGISIEKTKNNYYKYYFTTHYCTELTN